MLPTLSSIVADFAAALTKADGRHPVARSQRSERLYRPGIGPHAENAAVALAFAELGGESRWGQFIAYPGLPRQKCDAWVGEPLEWVLEVKMARLRGDNGNPDDTAIKDILSPYAKDRSALTDCVKLAASEFACGKAVLIYGFDYTDRPLDPLIEAFEALARTRVDLGMREMATLGPLVHPVHTSGRVFGWEVR